MTEKIKIAFFDTKSYDELFFNAENERYRYEIKYFEPHLTSDTASLAKGFNAVCVFVNDSIDEKTIRILHSNGVKLIALRCAGYNNVDLKAVFTKIHVVRVPEYSPYAVAEHAAALILSLNRKIHRAYYRVRDNNFSIKGLLGFDMRGKTAGIIGTGRIGRVLIDILLGFGMRVLGHDLHQNSELEKKSGFSYSGLDRIYSESDIISLHCPLTKENHHMINSSSISRMKPGVMIINTSRGRLIDTSALIDGLKSGVIGSAGLDVYEEESEYFFEDKSDEIILDDALARLNSFNNVIVTSHQAFFTREAMTNISAVTMKNTSDFFADKPLVNEICYHCGNSVCLKKDSKKGRCF